MKQKSRIYKPIVLPILLYGSDCWTVYRKQIQFLEKFHERQLRNILPIKWQDYISNKKILEQASCDSTERILVKNQLRWVSHTCRMAEEHLLKQMFYGEPAQGRRTLGGQVKRYKDALHMTLKNANIQKDWRKLCEDRPLSRRICNQNNGIFNQCKQRQKRPIPGNIKASCRNCGRTIGSRIARLPLP